MTISGICRAYAPTRWADRYILTVVEQTPNGVDGKSHQFTVPTEMLQLDPDQSARCLVGAPMTVVTDTAGTVKRVKRGGHAR